MSVLQNIYRLDKCTIYRDGHPVLMLAGVHDGTTPQDRQALRERIVRLLNEDEGPRLDCPGVDGGKFPIGHLFITTMGKPAACARCGLALADYRPAT